MELASVKLESGRKLQLSQINLSQTYNGLLAGYPHASLNDGIIRTLAKTAGTLMPCSPVHVIEPVRRHRETRYKGAFGPVEELPSVICVARFSSNPVDPSLDDILWRSGLVVAWFQEDVTIPHDQQAPDALRAIRWDELAEDWEL